MNKADIADRADIERLINNFYSRVQADPLLAPVFAHVDWPAHLPTMYNFWSSIVLGDQSYRGNPFQKHINLPISAAHFAAWLKLFTATVDEFYTGEQAEGIKTRAQQIAEMFQHRLNLR